MEPKRFVCNTESVEGGTGMQARVTIEIADGYRFEETFELASPGQELKVFFTNSWTRSAWSSPLAVEPGQWRRFST